MINRAFSYYMVLRQFNENIWKTNWYCEWAFFTSSSSSNFSVKKYATCSYFFLQQLLLWFWTIFLRFRKLSVRVTARLSFNRRKLFSAICNLSCYLKSLTSPKTVEWQSNAHSMHNVSNWAQIFFLTRRTAKLMNASVEKSRERKRARKCVKK